MSSINRPKQPFGWSSPCHLVHMNSFTHKAIWYCRIRFQAFAGQKSRNSCIPIKWIYEATEPNTDLYFQPSSLFSTLALKTILSENKIGRKKNWNKNFTALLSWRESSFLSIHSNWRAQFYHSKNLAFYKSKERKSIKLSLKCMWSKTISHLSFGMQFFFGWQTAVTGIHPVLRRTVRKLTNVF